MTKTVLPTKNKSINPILVPGKNGWIKKLLIRVIRPYLQLDMKNAIATNPIPKSILKNEDPKKKGIILEIVALINEKDNINAEKTNEKKIDLFLENIIFNL
ncbi:MAG: hypothetical protein ACRCWU_01120 [Metamycoplasmataceae bacterium]